jgi:hypothetical protein
VLSRNLKIEEAMAHVGPQSHRKKSKIFTGIKGKAISLQAWIGPEGSRRMRLPDFMTFGT